MIYVKPKSVTGLKIAVTNTATLLYSLMDTAGSETGSREYYNNLLCNGLIILPEDGDIRMLWADNPTSTQGRLLTQGTEYLIAGIQIDNVRLIRVGSSNVATTVIPCKTVPNEASSSVPTDDATETTLEAVAGLVTVPFDNIAITYTGSNPTTIVYKVGVTTVRTITCTYDGSNNLLTATAS